MTSHLKQEIPRRFCFLLFSSITCHCPHSFGGVGKVPEKNLLDGFSNQKGLWRGAAGLCHGVSRVKCQDQAMTGIVSAH